jgi:uncharacterized membrane protein YgcG
MKIFKIIIVSLFFFGCSNKSEQEKLVVDAGSFLEKDEQKKIETAIGEVNKKGECNLFFYTVIAEKYYQHKHYDSYVFQTISKKDSINNKTVLIYLSYDDKKIKINTGNKAREVLTDSLSQIAINRLVPFLSNRNYYQGIKSTIIYIDSLFSAKKNS